MSSRTGLAILLTLSLAAGSAAAEDWSAFVAASDHGDDGMILELLQGSDFQAQIAICESIGLRSDPDATSILSWLLSGFSKTGEYRIEHLLRLAMTSLFDPSRGDQALRARLDANAAVIEEMVRHIARFEDPQLKGLIVKLLPGLRSTDRLGALLEAGTGIVDQLRRSGGYLSAPDTGLAYDYLAVTREIGTGDFLEPCIAIARLSRDQDLVRDARQVSMLIASRPR